MIKEHKFGDYKWVEFSKQPFWKRWLDSIHTQIHYALVVAVLFGAVFMFLKIMEIILRWI